MAAVPPRPSEDAWLEVRAPATSGVIARVPRGDVDRALAAASAAFRSWRHSTPRDRATALLELADRLTANAAELGALESAGTGKPLPMAHAEMEYSADVLRFFAGAARTLTAPAAGEYEHGSTSMVRREPLGVVAAIVPWNYPLLMVAYKLGPALAAGNTLVVKPSELTPLTALRLAELAADVLPEGVLEVVCGEGQPVGARLAAHPDVRMIALTGSVATGRAVAAAAGGGLKRTHLELGGKAPVVVLGDADPGEVAAAIRTAGYWNSGQDCMAACRVLVAASRHEALLDALVSEVDSIRVGPPELDGVEMGPVISASHRRRVLGLVDDGRRAGGRLVRGGGAIDTAGYFVEPTLIDGVEQASAIVQREVFGPVVTVQAVRDEAEALAWAGDVPYGLAASIWTADAGRALAIARDLDFGAVWINQHAVTSPELPHAGRGESGHGTDLSTDSLREYTAVKHVMARLGG